MQREGREKVYKDIIYWVMNPSAREAIFTPKEANDVIDQHTANVWKAAQESMIKDVHKKFPVPDMEHAEMWPHDEQIRWAGIGEVISYLNSKV